jgi:ankyrin repeat protein
VSGQGVTELIAACGFETQAPAVGPHSFTNALIRELEQAFTGPPLFVAELHSRIIGSLKNWKPDLLRDNHGNVWTDETGSPRYECHKRRTPVHCFLTNETPYRSIMLAPLPSKLSHDAMAGIPLTAPPKPSSPSSGNFCLSSQDSQASISTAPTGVSESAETSKALQVLLSVRLEDDYFPGDDEEIYTEKKVQVWSEWLRNMPQGAKSIKIQGIYKSYSTLVLLTMPVVFWDLLPNNAAYSFVGFVESVNLAPRLLAKDATLATQLASGSEHRHIHYDPKRQLAQMAQDFEEVILPITIDARTSDMWMAPSAKSGNVAAVQLLLEKGVDIEARIGDHGGKTVLHLAAENGREAVVQMLLAKGADIEAKTRFYETALHLAVENGHKAVVQTLLEKGADIEARAGRYKEKAVLHLAAENGREAVVQLLLSKGADLEAKTDDYEGQKTALHFAAGNGHEAVVQLLLEQGANLEAKTDDYEGQRTALHFAAGNGHEAVVQMLLEKGADLDAKTDGYGGKTALHFAAGNGHEAVVQMLLDKGANLEAKTDGYGAKTALHLAAENGHEAVVQLLDKGAVDGVQNSSRESDVQAMGEPLRKNYFPPTPSIIEPYSISAPSSKKNYSTSTPLTNEPSSASFLSKPTSLSTPSSNRHKETLLTQFKARMVKSRGERSHR